jgi:hypothetical protein
MPRPITPLGVANPMWSSTASGRRSHAVLGCGSGATVVCCSDNTWVGFALAVAAAGTQTAAIDTTNAIHSG